VSALSHAPSIKDHLPAASSSHTHSRKHTHTRVLGGDLAEKREGEWKEGKE
jgi:hypothetical protein